MTDQRKPAAILFDMGDTVIRPVSYDREAGIRALLSRARGGGGSDEAFVEELAEQGRRLDARFEEVCARENLEYRQSDFMRLLYGRAGIEFDLEDLSLEQLYWDRSLAFEKEPGIAEALDAVRRAGLRTAAVSNTVYTARVLDREMERQCLAGRFEFILSSADYGVRKPDPLLFEVALAKLGLPAERCWYAGNFVDIDVAGALAAGMRPLWYSAKDERDGRAEAAAAALPAEAIRISRWAELAGVL
jgi:putative hydrolase of the HAD superfamily